MKEFQTFIFDSCSFNPTNGEIRLRYTLDDEISFTEILEVPVPDTERSTPQSALETLHLAGGASYYKTCCPKAIEVRSCELSEEQANFWNSVYENGLGEFFYKNEIDFRNLINFPSSPVPKFPDEGNREVRKSGTRGSSGRSLVPIGGGKDSLVTIEKLRAEGKKIALLRMGSHPIIDELVSITGLPCITVQRKLPRKLFEMNEQGALNGHVPITAFLSALAVFIAELHGFDEVVMSNEKSANFGNTEYLGKEINHQWSKSEEFENAFQKYIQENIDPDLRYFSKLRDLTELQIVEEFVKFPQYFDSFTSCNKNWKIAAPTPTPPPKGEGLFWCKTCPKCAFVFVLLAAHLRKETVEKIFGGNPLEIEENTPLFRQLLGLEGFKPFECVGTPEEMKEAFDMIKARGEIPLPL